MKIALVSDWYSPRLGGIESHLAELKQRLTDAGHEVHVVTTTPGPEGNGVHRVKASRLPWAEVMYTPAGARALAEAIDRVSPDVVHSHVSIVSPTAFIGAKHAQRRGIGTVLTFHSFIPATPAYMGVVGALCGARKWNAVLTAVSGRVAREVESFAGRPVEVLSNGVDCGFWRRDDAGRGVYPEERSDEGLGINSRKAGSPGAVALVSVMRLNPKKRPGMLVQLAKRLRRRRGKEFTLTIVGDGPMLRQMRAMTAGMPGVELTGRLTRDQVRAIYARSDIFVLPTERESFGLAALEARSMGLPVVAMRQSGLGEMISDGVE